MAGLHVWRWACLATHWLKMPTPSRPGCCGDMASDSCGWRCILTQGQTLICAGHTLNFFLSHSDFHPHQGWEAVAVGGGGGGGGGHGHCWQEIQQRGVQGRAQIWSCQLCMLWVLMTLRKAWVQWVYGGASLFRLPREIQLFVLHLLAGSRGLFPPCKWRLAEWGPDSHHPVPRMPLPPTPFFSWPSHTCLLNRASLWAPKSTPCFRNPAKIGRPCNLA